MFFVVNVRKNVFDLNPTLETVSEFSALKKQWGKRRASNILWSIYLAHHPSSAIYKLEETVEGRQKRVNKDYNAKDSIVKFEKYEDLTKVFLKVCIDEGLKSLNHWEQVLKEYDSYEKSLLFKDNFDKKLKALSEKKKIFDMYMDAREHFFIEDSNAKMANKGGYQESAGAETGELFPDKDG